MPTTPFRHGSSAGGAGGDDVEMQPAKLDCYPYTFSPLLLFAQEHYFDPGYSNYNSVAQFFASCLEPMGVDMLENVLYDHVCVKEACVYGVPEAVLWSLWRVAGRQERKIAGG